MISRIKEFSSAKEFLLFVGSYDVYKDIQAEVIPQSIQDSIESELPQRILLKLPQEYQCRHSSSVLWIYMLFCQGFQYCVHLYTLHMYSKYPKFCGVKENNDEILRHWYSQGSFDNFRQGSSLSIESYMLCGSNAKRW